MTADRSSGLIHYLASQEIPGKRQMVDIYEELP